MESEIVRVETSVDGSKWTESDRRIDNRDLNGSRAIWVFEVRESAQCRFIKLVNLGKNHYGDETLVISAWKIFGTLH
jgi:hypothetical protein